MSIEVIVTGGREYMNRALVYKVLDSLNVGLLVEGGCSGADSLAREWARRKDVPVVTRYAEWSKHGKAAGPMRNKEMLDEFPNALVLAFPGGAGTKNCMSQAKKLGRVVLQAVE